MKMSGYNIMRDDSAILEEHENSPPSFSVRLYPDHWTLNSGPKFSYNNHVSSILEDIRAFRIPTDFIQIFDDAGVPYYNGCLIVEILDFRPARAKEPILERPDKQRVVLRPNPETIWADICILNAKNGAKWSDMDALQVESKLLLSTSTPLCLDPDPSLMRIVNSILRVSTPNVPNSLKRKAAAMVDLEEDETEKAKRAKIMQFMNPQFNSARKPLHTNYKILALLEQRRLAASAGTQQKAQPTSNTTIPTNLPSGTMVPPNINNQQTQDKTTTTVIPSLTTSYSQSNSVPQPVPTPAPAPQTQAPPQVQHAIDPSHRMSPSKQQQAANNPTPQRPPSQPVVAPQTNTTNQQPQPQPQPQQQQQQQQQQQGQGQVQAQQPAQSSQFTPSIPPTNFLHAPPTSRRRPSTAVHPGTPAVPNTPLPAQQAASQGQTQPQPQAQTQPQVQVQAQAQQGQAQQQVAVQPTAQQQPQPVQQAAQPARPPQVPTSMTSMQNMTQFYQNNRAMPMTQATAAMVAAAAAAQRQQALTNGRNTPANAGNANPNASPVPPLPPSAMTRSPMIPPAAVAAMMSRQNTPVATGGQVARGSPLAGNHAAVRAAAAPQQQPQQLGQQTVPGGQPVMMQPGAATVAPNPALAYQYQMQQHQRIQTYFRAQLQMQQAQAQQQAQMQQQGRMTPAVQQQQQQQHAQQQQQSPQAQGVRPKSAGQDHQQQQTQQQVQFNGMQQQQQQQTQQAFAGMQMPYNYMNLGAQHPQHYLWQQRQMGRGMGQMGQGSGQAVMPPGMTIQQMQGLGRGGLPNR